MGKKAKPIPFSLEGRFLGFLLEDGYKIKWLRLIAADGEHCIKLSKEARASVGGLLIPGDWIQIQGEQCFDKTGDVKRKAIAIVAASPRQTDTLAPSTPASTPSAPAKPAATILVCQKSDCLKRGGRAMCQALQAELHDRELDGTVTIKGTGCMKQCKAGPNLVMPNKMRYTRVLAQDIPALLDEHFPQQSQRSVQNAQKTTAHTLPISPASSRQ